MAEGGTTWEFADVRCGVCFCIFSASDQSEQSPVFCCSNLHTVCRKCISIMYGRKDNCPHCRTSLVAPDDANSNRTLISMIPRLQMRCGACSSQKLMAWEEAIAHTHECPLNRTRCPFFDESSPGCICNKEVNVLSVWEHCRAMHSTHNHIIDAEAVDGFEDKFSAHLSNALNMHSNANIFFSISHQDLALNFCLHFVKARDDNGNGIICVALRRFFSSEDIEISRVILALECSDLYGAVFPLREILPCHEQISVGTVNTVDKCVRIPFEFINNMKQEDYDMNKGQERSLSFVYTVQIDFLHCSMQS